MSSGYKVFASVAVESHLCPRSLVYVNCFSSVFSESEYALHQGGPKLPAYTALTDAIYMLENEKQWIV